MTTDQSPIMDAIESYQTAPYVPFGNSRLVLAKNSDQEFPT
jgi:hypothetical protein